MSSDATPPMASLAPTKEGSTQEESGKQKVIPAITERGLSRAAERAQAQAEALRANLARRKAQSRARSDDQN